MNKVSQFSQAQLTRKRRRNTTRRSEAAPPAFICGRALVTADAAQVMAVVMGACFVQTVDALTGEQGVVIPTGPDRGDQKWVQEKVVCNADCDDYLTQVPFYVAAFSVLFWLIASGLGESETEHLRSKVFLSLLFVSGTLYYIFTPPQPPEAR